MIIINEKNFATEIEACDKLCVIDLYADWCMPCKMLAPIFAELESEFENVKFCKINVDESPKLASLFHVESIPMVAIVKNNTFVDMSIGLVPKEALKKLIDANL